MSLAVAPRRWQRTAALFLNFCEPQYGAITRLIGPTGLQAFSFPALSLNSSCLDSAAIVIINADTPSPIVFAGDLRRYRTDIPIIVVTSNSSEELAIDALRAGVSDYMRAPSAADIINAICRFVPAENKTASAPIVGESAAIQRIRDYVLKLASTSSNVLITGETGTGKELVAKLIHAASNRSGKPLVCVNCAAIPENLLESELFGHERGAFTGADDTMAGQFECANGGTIFFDEIGDMNISAQAKILRVIEDRCVQRLGSRKSKEVDVRIVAATNRDLDSLAFSNEFRRDLYFRLNVGRIHLPPLRERKADIPALVRHYVEKFNASFGAQVTTIGNGVMESLLQYGWPGNVRELRNVIEAVYVSRPMSTIKVTDLPDWFRSRTVRCAPPAVHESDRLLGALEEMNWNKSKAAAKLGWSRMTLYRKMAKYHLLDRSGPESIA